MRKAANKKLIQLSVNDLPPGLANPARRALAAAGITRLEQFAQLSETELLKLHGMGPKSIQTIRAALAQCGLALAREGESRGVSEAANARIERRTLEGKR